MRFSQWRGFVPLNRREIMYVSMKYRGKTEFLSVIEDFMLKMSQMCSIKAECELNFFKVSNFPFDLHYQRGDISSTGPQFYHE